MDLPVPLPKPPVVKGVRELRANMSKYIEMVDTHGAIVIEVYGQDRKLKSKYQLTKVENNENENTNMVNS